jgi:branched-chain amino acid aminotransferase
MDLVESMDHLPSQWINYDGKLLRAESPFLTAASRAFRYGDGLFETILVRDGHLRLWSYHADRLFSGLHLLRFPTPSALTSDQLSRQILDLCQENGFSESSRVRLAVFRGEGGLFDTTDSRPHYVIESAPWPPNCLAMNEKGLAIDVFPGGRKACDELANLKSSNYLVYVLAALHAKSCGLDDCLVLNSRDRLADSAIANLFFVQAGQIFTPPLSEGGVAGVMRRHLLERMPSAGYRVEERPVTVADLLNAEEVFLTNVLRGIRWVASFGEARYHNRFTTAIFRDCIE